jgi:uncharacterized membrane-anchored protein YitT (DUF2179 family)
VNGDPFSSLFFIILCALLSLIPAISFKSFNDAVLILIGVVIFSYKFVLFFLPANIYGALMSLMACWFISCHTYHYFSATDLLISQLCRESFLWVIFFSSLSDCMYWLIFLSNIPFFEWQLYKRYHTCTYY